MRERSVAVFVTQRINYPVTGVAKILSHTGQLPYGVIT